MNIPEVGSYQGQDELVIQILDGKRGGFFLDSGASNGIRGSNTYRLERSFGWKGICIEPNEQHFHQLIRNRSCICLDCCLWRESGTVEFLESAGVYGGIVEAYDATLLRFAREQAANRSPSRTVSTVRKNAKLIGDVLRTWNAPRLIDYWSLDTEGSELEILKTFPFDEFGVRVLSVEHNFGPRREMLREFLETKGMHRIRQLGIDDVYVYSVAPRRGWRSTALRRFK